MRVHVIQQVFVFVNASFMLNTSLAIVSLFSHYWFEHYNHEHYNYLSQNT